MGLALHNYNDSYGSLPPTLGWRPKPTATNGYSPNGALGTLFFHILPFIEQTAVFNSTRQTRYYMYSSGAPYSYSYSGSYNDPTYGYNYSISYTYSYGSYTSIPGVSAYWADATYASIPLYQASHDPSILYSGSTYVSYLSNGEVFDKDFKVSTIPDGSSNTMFIAEGYANCYGYTSSYVPGQSYTYNYSSRYGQYNITYGYTYLLSEHINYTGSYYQQYYKTYDYTYGYSNTPSFHSIPGRTFQDSPPYGKYNCDGSVPQSLATGSIQVLLGDGHVRSVSASVSAASWTASLTPDMGDIIGTDF
jgi:uncharacterized protein DUF1559